MPLLSDSFTLLQDGVGAALAATASADPTLPNLANLVANWDAADGIAHDGVAATQWTSATGGLTLVDMGDVSDVGTSPAGGPALLTSGNVGMRAIGTGSLPVGVAARSAAVCLKVAPEAIGYCGFGWGATSGDNTSFVVGVDGDGNAAVDFRGARLASGANIWGRDVVVSADYDGTTVQLYLDGTFLTSVDVVLATGSDLVNLMTTFSGLPSGGRVMAAAAWNVPLSAAAHAQVYSFWYLRHLNDIMAPVASNVSLGAPKTSVSLSWAFDADEPGIFDLIVTENPNVPTRAQIIAGLDSTGAAAAYWLPDEPMSATNTGTATGLTPATPHYLFALLRDKSENRSILDGGAGVSTDAPDVAAPVLSSPSISKVLSSGYTGSVTTANDANGTLYIYVSDTAGAPSKTLVKTGTAYPVTAEGAQNFGGSWPSGTTGYGWALHVDAAGNEAASPTSLGTFTTDAVSASGFTPHTTAASVGALTSLLASWQSNWSGTASGLGLAANDERVVSCTFSTGSDIDLTDLDFSTGAGRRRVTIRQAGTFSQTGTGLSMRPTSTYSWSGRLKLDRSKNIRIALATISGDRRVSVGESTDVTVERINFAGSYTTPPTSSGNAPTTRNAMSGTDTSGVGTYETGPGTVTRCTIKNCLVQGFDDAGFMWNPKCNGTTFDGIVFDVIGHDTFKIGKGEHTNLTIKRCWGQRLICAKSGANYHEDFCQVAATKMINFTIEDSVWWKAQDDWYGSAVGVGQGLHGDDAGEGAQGISVKGMTVRQNISVMDAQPCKINTGANPNSIFQGIRTANSNAFFGTGSKPANSAMSDQTVGSGFSEKTNNLVCAKNGAGSHGSNATIIDIGPDAVNPNYAGYSAHITGVPGSMATSMFGVLLPKSGSPLHWDYAGADKCNAGARLKQILVQGDHPGNVGWPVAPIWTERYNNDDAVSSTYTGTYTSDGANV